MRVTKVVAGARVLFDGFWWAEGPVSNREVMKELILSWERCFPADQLIVAARSAHIDVVRADLPARVRLVGTRVPQHGLSAMFELPLVARRANADVTVTHNFAPVFGRSAVFVHDLIFVTHPEWFTMPERAYFSLMPLSLRRTRTILTSSGTEAERIGSVRHGRAPVVPVSLGLSRALERAEPSRPTDIDDVEDFLLAVGRINVRKNLGSAIEAAVRSGVATPVTPLLIVGESSGRRPELGPVVSAAVANGSVRFLGFIKNDELAWLYSKARVFIFLSLDEGFGMPTLEALHFGARSVVSDIPVFREILGERAVYVPPLDLQAAASGIREAFELGRPNPVPVNELGYSWDLSATRMRKALLGD